MLMLPAAIVEPIVHDKQQTHQIICKFNMSKFFHASNENRNKRKMKKIL